MNICINNIENGESKNWKFDSDKGAFSMMDLLEKSIGNTPEQAYFNEPELISVLLTNEQLEKVLVTVIDESDPFTNLLLLDISFLRYGTVGVQGYLSRPL